MPGTSPLLHILLLNIVYNTNTFVLWCFVFRAFVHLLQNVSFIVFCKVVHFTKRIGHFYYKLAEDKL